MSAPLTVTVTSPQVRATMVDALRQLADKLESGELQHSSGGIMVDNSIGGAGEGRIVVRSDLVLVRGTPTP